MPDVDSIHFFLRTRLSLHTNHPVLVRLLDEFRLRRRVPAGKRTSRSGEVFDVRRLRVTPDSNARGDAQNQVMRIYLLPWGVLWAVTLSGQSSSSTWQDRCFNNPGLPYCQGRDFAVKPTPQAKGAGTRGVVTNSFPSTPQNVSPSRMVVGSVDWRFADPSADVLLGFNFSELAASPLARTLIAQLGARQSLTDADVKKILDGLSGIDQIAVSVRDNRFVVMLTGGVTETTLPSPEAGMKYVPISGAAMLFGSADAVDQAARRIAMKSPLPELARSAEERQASSEFWAIGSARAMGPQAVRAGVKRFSLTVSIRSRLASDLAIEFNGPPSARTLQMLTMPSGSTLEGTAVHARISMEASEVQQKFGEIVASAAGERLAALVQAARHLPARDTTIPEQTRPVIYGLDGGPRVVGQEPDK